MVMLMVSLGPEMRNLYPSQFQQGVIVFASD
jgi:hypothetical protein